MNNFTQALLWIMMGMFIKFGLELIEVQKEIRNEIQAASAVVENRISCVELVYDGKAELSVHGKK